MKQSYLFGHEEHEQKLRTKYKNPLMQLNSIVDWECFRETIYKHVPEKNRTKGGRPGFDKVMLFKVLILQDLYDLSDEQAEYQIMDRSSFLHFLGLAPGDRVPDQNTIWLFRENLTNSGGLDALFLEFGARIAQAGLLIKKGDIVDASIVSAPIQRNSRDENKTIKSGNIPEHWSDKKRSHKDVDADWTKKNNTNHFGYKNHVKIDSGSKLITDFQTTAASTHDSQVLEDLIGLDDAGQHLYADSAYRSDKIEKMLKGYRIKSKIHEKGNRKSALSEEQKQRNKAKSKVRARVEHVFGWMHRAGHQIKVRVVGLTRATAKMTLTVLTYNMTRCEFLLRNQEKSVSMV